MSTERPPYGDRGRGSVNHGMRGRGRADLANTPQTTPTSTAVHDDTPTSRVLIRWGSGHTNTLVQFLDTHPAHCHVLFNESKKARDPTINEPSPSGNKSKIWADIAQQVFENDAEYGSMYVEEKNKFMQVVSNHLSYLRTKYKEYHSHFKQTGAGVNPLDASEQVLLEFPWFDMLDGLWKDNPAYALTMISSALGLDHASGMAALTAGKGKGQQIVPPPPVPSHIDEDSAEIPDVFLNNIPGPVAQGKGKEKAPAVPDFDDNEPMDFVDSASHSNDADTHNIPHNESFTFGCHPTHHPIIKDAIDDQSWQKFEELQDEVLASELDGEEDGCTICHSTKCPCPSPSPLHKHPPDVKVK
ncbi:hypothetical protein BDR03DRAFT_1007614 [Suillus americanus]|nr:hypothetical protein BDR03DRAFT_1007614 [Suillus americanus]